MTVRSRGVSALGGLGLALAVAGCGGGSPRLVQYGAASGGGLSDAAGPIQPAGPAWAALHGPSHYGSSTVVGPQTASLRWKRTLSGSAGPGPVVSARGVAYDGSNGGRLYAIDVASGKVIWTFKAVAAWAARISRPPRWSSLTAG
ncbi:MAG TPA: PQQ-binding-like beta-propeller repeat protein [Solirubrobacteraceae bacterium]|nr:PQQ-binding-like beta-propeller repeat protein [Solirubrobacteraceae bacterium]